MITSVLLEQVSHIMTSFSKEVMENGSDPSSNLGRGVGVVDRGTAPFKIFISSTTDKSF